MLDVLRRRLATVSDLHAAASVLEWDQETYMPAGAAEARAEQLATLKRLAHDILISDETADLLSAEWVEDLEDDLDRVLLRVTRRDFERAKRRPSELVEAQARASARALEAWKRARSDDDFAFFQPHLADVLTLAREEADALGFEHHVYDALIEEYEPGMTHADVERVFAPLRADLASMVAEIATVEQVDDSVVWGHFDRDAQWSLGMEVARAIGYDLERGRQDVSAHPFSTSFTPPYDVRITTRIAEDFFPTAFFGTLHEVGHALYEQGFDPTLARTPLAAGTSLGMHESQSRLWENLVGRSRAFWEYCLPIAQHHFPAQFQSVKGDEVWRAVNRVAPSLIRVEADEVTYSLHVMLRFELESAMLTGDLSVADLPAAWNDGMAQYLGLTPSSDADGCLQDIHWAMGAIGYFPTYALGSLMSVQLFDAASAELKVSGSGEGIDGMIARGDFAPLLGWLREHVHAPGRTRSASEIMERATGVPVSAEPWLAYARRKFSQVYT